MAAAKSRVSRITRRQQRAGAAEFGKLGKQALRKKILALRDSGPVHVLKWVNDDYLLQRGFEHLAQLGRLRVSRLRDRHNIVVSEERRRTTGGNLHAELVAVFNLAGADRSNRNLARTILEELSVAPAAWVARIRRCAYESCARPI